MQFFDVNLKKNLIFFFIIALVFAIDRASKIYIINFFLNEQINIYYLNKFINLVLIWNSGIAFGLFESENFSYHFISFLIFLVISFFFIVFFKSKKQSEKIFLSFLIGGALGNFYDRLVYSAVPDFIDLHYMNYHWFVFNVSDIIITISILMYIINDLIVKKND